MDRSTVLCEIQTSQSRIRIALAVRTVFRGGLGTAPHDADSGGGRYRRQFDLRLADGQPVTITRTAAVETSRDGAISSPSTGVLAELSRSGDGEA